MTSAHLPPILPAADIQPDADLLQLALPVSQKVVLVVDVVESVRLMASNEADAVSRWVAFAQAGQATISAQHGRVVKSLGDGLMAEFDQPRDAVAAALQLHCLVHAGNAGVPPERHMLLRAGAHATRVYVGGHDIYGAGVNLAARIATLAGPGETVVTAEVHDGLTDGLDAELEDLGECHLKHIEHPVRAYRVGRVGPSPVIPPRADIAQQLGAKIAVVPFESRSGAGGQLAVGDLIADGLINLLSGMPQLCVLSRLSTRNLATTLKQGGSPAPGLANYLLTGAYADFGGKALVSWELSTASDSRVLATGRQTVALIDLLEPSCDFFMQAATDAVSAMMAEEVGKTSRQAIPTLPSYSLMLAGVSEMHRNSLPALNRSYAALNSLIDRHPRFAQPKAWLAKWYVLRSVTSAGSSTPDEAKRALELTQRALDIDPTNSMSLAMQGYVYNHMVGDPERALHSLDQAIKLNPNDSLAWLYHSVVQGMWGDPAQAVSSSSKAFALSPLDPLAYFYKSLLASALLADGQCADAATAAQESLRLNRLHTPSYRVLLTAQHGMGQLEAASQTLKALMDLEPHFSLQAYSSGFSAQSRTKKQTIEALKAINGIKPQ